MNIDSSYFDDYLDSIHPPVDLGGEIYRYSYVYRMSNERCYDEDRIMWELEQKRGKKL